MEVAFSAALASWRPHVLAIERALLEQLLPTVPAELREEALRRAMNGLGNELFIGTGLAGLAGSGEAGELM